MKLLTTQEAADKLQISKKTFYKYRSENRYGLGNIKMGIGRKFLESDLDRLIENQFKPSKR